MSHEQYRDCIDACNACADACDHCSTACLREPNVSDMARCIQLDIDCAQMCRLAAGAMARSSEFASQICSLCAEICEVCGDDCARFSSDHCRSCADACRRCAQACRQMAGSPKGWTSGRGATAGAH